MAAVTLLALLLAGCSRVTFSSQFDEDGTAAHQIEVVLERSGIAERDLTAIVRELDAAEQRAREDGFTTSRIDSATQIGLRVSNETSDALDAGAALNSMFNSIAGEDETGPIAPFTGTFEKRGEAVGGTVHDLELTVDGPVLVRAVQRLAPGNRQFASPAEVGEVVTFRYRATMPGEVRRTDGVQLGASGVTWDIGLSGTTSLNASSTVGKETPWGLVAVAIVAALGAVALAGRAVMELLLRRRREVAPPVHGAVANPAVRPPLETLADVRTALLRLFRRLATGLPLGPQPDRSPGNERTAERGTDAEGA